MINLYGSRNLTDREIRLTELVRDGLTNGEIAAILGTTLNVIKKDIRPIYDKTGMGNRVELALWYEAHLGQLSRQRHRHG